jgi:signal transduction histidine kinase/ligand-binding sensor domain-containing protein
MTLNRLFVLFICIMFSACWFNNRPIPLPANPTEFAPPVQKSFKFTDPVKFTWKVVPKDSIHPGHIYPFDINKLPSRPFHPDGFVAMPKPPAVTTFSYRSLPDTAFNIDAIASEPLKTKTSVLGPIHKTSLGTPKLSASGYTTSFQYSVEQGLPNSAITNTIHTKNGACWIATSEGLCIVYGESIEILPNTYGTILFMSEDGLGRVWVASKEHGMFIIDRRAGIQTQFILPGSFTIQPRIDAKGYVWITDATVGVYRLSPDLKTFQHFSTRNGLSSNNSVITYEDRDGRIWITNSGTGLDIIDLTAKKIKRMRTVLGAGVDFGTSMMQNPNGDMLVLFPSNGIEIISLKQETIKHIDTAQGLSKSFLKNMVRDYSGNVWMAADLAGVYIINKTEDSLSHLTVQDGISDIEIDRNQQIFMGTKSGLSVFPAPESIAHHLSVKDGLLSSQVWGLLEDDKKRLWIGTYSGINIITPENKILSYVPEQKNQSRFDKIIQTGPGEFLAAGPGSGLMIINEIKHTAEKIDLKEGLPNNEIFSLFQDKKGLIWLGCYNATVAVFNPVNREIRYLHLFAGISSDRVTGFLQDSLGNMYLTNYGEGLEYIDSKANTICHYSPKEGLSSDKVGEIERDAKNRYWLGTENGIDLLDPVKQTNTIFTVASGLPSKGVYSLIQNNNTIFAGTEKGLVLINENEKTNLKPGESPWELQTYNKSLGFGFIDFNGNTVARTSDNKFWWGIVEGATNISGDVFKSDSVIGSPEVSGLDIFGKSQYFIDPGIISNIDTVWYENGDSFVVKSTFSRINTDLSKGIRNDSLTTLGIPVNLSLPSDLNYLRFHFSRFLPEKNGIYKYSYILDGVDEKWSNVTDQPVSENYNNISPGYYTFRVSIKKGLGAWSEPSIYSFRIRPPWWQSWWAELIYILFLVSLIRFWVRYRSRRLLKENIMLEEKVKERTTALSTSLENLRQTQGQLIQAEKMASLGELTAGIAHEIQNPLNFVNNFSEVNTELVEEVNKALEEGNIPEARELLRDVEMNMEKITFHGKRADTIVKGMLLHSRANSGQKIPTNVNTLADEYLRLSYHGLRAKDKSFNAQFSMDLDPKMQEILLVQQDIGRVFLNLFNNAFYSVTEKKKLSESPYEPMVSVITRMKSDIIEIRIRDNGVGIPKKVLDKIYQPFFTTKPAGQGTGLGLSLSYDIITKEHGGKIDVVTKENDFTEFIIELPILAVGTEISGKPID